MNGQKPTKQTWEQLKEELEIAINNTEKRLKLMMAQLEEVNIQIK